MPFFDCNGSSLQWFIIEYHISPKLSICYMVYLYDVVAMIWSSSPLIIWLSLGVYHNDIPDINYAEDKAIYNQIKLYNVSGGLKVTVFLGSRPRPCFGSWGFTSGVGKFPGLCSFSCFVSIMKLHVWFATEHSRQAQWTPLFPLPCPSGCSTQFTSLSLNCWQLLALNDCWL